MDTEELLTPKEVADALRISVKTVQAMLRNGTLPHIDHGYRLKRIRRSDLNAYIEKRYKNANS